MMVTLLGIFLTLANALTLLALMLGVVWMGTQVRLEEEHLSRMYPKVYEGYRMRVRRWIQIVRECSKRSCDFKIR
jgi:protein-S-isoprenylcysteine O-methyltransferase Ste14